MERTGGEMWDSGGICLCVLLLMTVKELYDMFDTTVYMISQHLVRPI